MAFKIAIWDWNGTLVSDFDVAYSAMQKIFGVFAPNIAPPSPETYKDRLDMANPGAFYREYGIPDEVSFHAMRSVFTAHYQLHRLSLNEGAKHALFHLWGRGIINAMVSAASTENVMDEMARLGIGQFFQRISLQAYEKDVVIGETLSYFGIKPHQAFYVGDTVDDIVKAKRAGVTTFGILNGHNSNHLVRAAKPNHVISSLREIIPIIRKKQSRSP